MELWQGPPSQALAPPGKPHREQFPPALVVNHQVGFELTTADAVQARLFGDSFRSLRSKGGERGFPALSLATAATTGSETRYHSGNGCKKYRYSYRPQRPRSHLR